MVTQQLVESLLWEAEGTALDFKSEQYNIEGATEDKKGELIKDILAFANAFRRSDAYILIGAKENPGGRAEIVGISSHIEDAHIQQLVNTKVQRPIDFSYRTIELEGKKIGVIQIPRQKRPFHLKANYGSVLKGVVYVRRGSSTALATPDEIASMGADQLVDSAPEPVLTLSLWNPKSGQTLGTNIDVRSVDVVCPSDKDIPDYRETRDTFAHTVHVNDNYHRELARYLRVNLSLNGYSFQVVNSGDVTAPGVRCVLEISDANNLLTFMHEDDRPRKPKRHRDLLGLMSPATHTGSVNNSLSVAKIGRCWRVELDVGKIQPKATTRIEERLFVGARRTMELELEAQLFADNLSNPIKIPLRLHATAETINLSHKQLLNVDFDHLAEARERVVGDLAGDESED